MLLIWISPNICIYLLKRLETDYLGLKTINRENFKKWLIDDDKNTYLLQT